MKKLLNTNLLLIVVTTIAMTSCFGGKPKIEEKPKVEKKEEAIDNSMENVGTNGLVANPISVTPVIVPPIILRPVVITSTPSKESDESSTLLEVPSETFTEGGENLVSFDLNSGDTSLLGVNDKTETTYSSTVEAPKTITSTSVFSSVEGGDSVIAFELDSYDDTISGTNAAAAIVDSLGVHLSGVEGDNYSTGLIEFDMYNAPPVIQGISPPTITTNELSKLSYFFDAYYQTINAKDQWAGSNIEVPKQYRTLFPNVLDIPLVKKSLKAFDYKYYNVVREGRASTVTGLIDRVECFGTKDNNCITYEQLEDVYTVVLGVLLTYVNSVNSVEDKAQGSTVYNVAKQIAHACVEQKTNEYKAQKIKAQVKFLTSSLTKKVRKTKTKAN